MDENCYQFPELLPQEEIVEILTNRMVVCNNEHCVLEKDKLIDLFRKFIVPLPQRVQLKRAAEKRKPREMLKYIKNFTLKRKR